MESVDEYLDKELSLLIILQKEQEQKGIASNLVRNFVPEKSHKSIMLH